MFGVPWKLIGLAVAALALVSTVILHFRNDARTRDKVTRYEQQFGAIRVEFENGGIKKPKAGEEVDGVRLIIRQRDAARSELQLADSVIDRQSATIDNLGARRAEAVRKAEQAQKLMAEMKRQRDYWIAEARNASTRTERRSAEDEVAECESVMDDLRRQGF